MVGICSCEKEEVTPKKVVKVEISSQEKDGGDDDDDPIIQGFVYKDSVLVDSVRTAIVPVGSVIPFEVTTDNGFQMQIPEGSYFFEVTPFGKSTIISDDISIKDDAVIDLNI